MQTPPRRASLRFAAAATTLLAIAGLSRAEAPEVDYMLECRGCHGADGAGRPGAVPSFRDSVARFLTVPGGREYLVRVPGSAQAPLDDAALAAVLNWIVRSYGPERAAAGFRPFDAAEVGRLRAAPLTDVDAVRAELVRRMGAVP